MPLTKIPASIPEFPYYLFKILSLLSGYVIANMAGRVSQGAGDPEHRPSEAKHEEEVSRHPSQ